MKPVAGIVVGVFTLIALVHVHRLVFGWMVVINGTVMPMWTSAAGAVIAGSLAFLLWRESRAKT
jgi:hypothetical protein